MHSHVSDDTIHARYEYYEQLPMDNSVISRRIQQRIEISLSIAKKHQPGSDVKKSTSGQRDLFIRLRAAKFLYW